MSVPPVPPRPYSAQANSYTNDPNPPPLPPLPPDLRYDQHYDSAPHFENPLAAPRPHRMDPSIPANMARTLDDQLDYRSNINFSPGFAIPAPAPARGPSPLPPPQGGNWSPWAPQVDPTYQPSPRTSSYGSPQPDLAFTSPPLPQPPKHQNSLPPPQQPPPARDPTPPAPSLTAPIPTLAKLQGVLPTIQNPNHDPALRLAWARDVLFLVDKQQYGATSTDTPQGPAVISDSQLFRLVQIAVPLILQIATAPHGGLTSAEAVYHRATFEASGAYPEHVPLNLKAAFRDFEAAARAGYASAWFRLGRDYENFNNMPHAKECFERGVKMGVESCLYRMGMANLMGQLALPVSPTAALPLLYRAALLATQLVPQPAYVYALLLLGEFSQLPAPLPPDLFIPFLEPTTSNQPLETRVLLEARRHLERAAFLGFAPAQYKLGHAYEFAQPPYPFDALLSVQYYSLASQQGEVEADMALSKWFLCGSGDTEKGVGFEKDEALAWTFANKAAQRGLPSAEFAMGYYAEVGVGKPGMKKDLAEAQRWYTIAKDHGNTDAAERLAALSQSSSQALSRQEHDAITENKLVRKRTQAKQRSEAMGLPSSPYPQGALHTSRVIDPVLTVLV
ncbi:hypothetical protein BDZ94DRAFT_114754 [Collybia nuda]|uniref:HCP-like protein n=1 Tax=Collybia nuda TaxID=64659 RepID=A0A9P6CAD5_9AGAR|nr:hypothetical protein BDZ94DRAFT_114754 [Collybia nuda]